MLRLQTDVADAAANQKIPAVFVYYRGHGVIQNNMTCAFLNEATPFPLEAQLRSLSSTNNCSVVAVLNCGRKMLSESQSFALPPLFVSEGTANIVLTFCSKANTVTSPTPSFAMSYFRYARSKAMPLKSEKFNFKKLVDFQEEAGASAEVEHCIELSADLWTKWTDVVDPVLKRDKF